MIVDLVKTVTADGVHLHGALHAHTASRPGGAPPATRGDAAAGTLGEAAVDVLLCVPGVGGNFYGSGLADELTPYLTESGLDVLWVNTRGHDSVSIAYSERGPRRQGAAYEIVDECRHDLTAWVDFLVERGYQSPAVLGHSLGAIKALYSQSFAPHPRLACLIAISPPRLSCRAFTEGPEGSRFFGDLDTARRHLEAGQPRVLFDTHVPFPMVMSAAAYVDKYGPAERYNILEFAGRVACPHLYVYGGRELEQGGIAFAGLPEALAGLAERRFRAPIHVVADADHMYTRHRRPLAEAVLAWLGDRRPAS
jgi:hypothetical protein